MIVFICDEIEGFNFSAVQINFGNTWNSSWYDSLLLYVDVFVLFLKDGCLILEWNSSFTLSFIFSHKHFIPPLPQQQSNYFSVKTFFPVISVDGSYCVLCLGCFPSEGETALCNLCCAAVGASWICVAVWTELFKAYIEDCMCFSCWIMLNELWSCYC